MEHLLLIRCLGREQRTLFDERSNTSTVHVIDVGYNLFLTFAINYLVANLPYASKRSSYCSNAYGEMVLGCKAVRQWVLAWGLPTAIGFREGKHAELGEFGRSGLFLYFLKKS